MTILCYLGAKVLDGFCHVKTVSYLIKFTMIQFRQLKGKKKKKGLLLFLNSSPESTYMVSVFRCQTVIPHNEDVMKRKLVFNLFLFQSVIFYTDCQNSLLEYYNLQYSLFRNRTFLTKLLKSASYWYIPLFKLWTPWSPEAYRDSISWEFFCRL